MKKCILLLGFLFIGITSQSQVLISLLLGDKLNSDKLEFGLESGVNWSTIGEMESTSSLAAFNIGFYFDFKLKNPQWSVYTGVLVKSNLGLNHLRQSDLDFLEIEKQEENEEEDGSYKQKMKTFMVPALMKYKFQNGIYLEGGIQLAWVSKAFVEYKSEFAGIETETREENRDLIHRIDGGLLGGVGYQFKKGNKTAIGAKYYYGLLDVYKERSGSNNKSAYVYIRIPIGAKKAKKKEEQEKEDRERAELLQKNEELQNRIEELEKE